MDDIVLGSVSFWLGVVTETILAEHKGPTTIPWWDSWQREWMYLV